MKLELETLSGTGGKGRLVGGGVIRELDDLMSTGELYKRGERADELETTRLYVLGVNILCDLMIKDAILGRLD